jgi:hypothetical protein
MCPSPRAHHSPLDRLVCSLTSLIWSGYLHCQGQLHSDRFSGTEEDLLAIQHGPPLPSLNPNFVLVFPFARDEHVGCWVVQPFRIEVKPKAKSTAFRAVGSDMSLLCFLPA